MAAILPQSDSAPTAPPAPAPSRRPSRLVPPLLALVAGLLIWEGVYLSGWRPDYVLPGPMPVLKRLVEEIAKGEVLAAAWITLGRAVWGYAVAVVIGLMAGLLMARFRPLRAALGALITGLQTMPSVAWFPLAILLFQLGEGAIGFVVVLGAAPSIANGLLHAVDHIPPLLLRAGRVLGANGFNLYRHVVLPAAMPGLVAGLKQGWAFAWRSLMAGELLVVVGDRPSIGARLHYARELSDAEGLLAWMIVVLTFGVVVDVALFGALERRIRERRGLGES